MSRDANHRRFPVCRRERKRRPVPPQLAEDQAWKFALDPGAWKVDSTAAAVPVIASLDQPGKDCALESDVRIVSALLLMLRDSQARHGSMDIPSLARATRAIVKILRSPRRFRAPSHIAIRHVRDTSTRKRDQICVMGLAGGPRIHLQAIFQRLSFRVPASTASHSCGVSSA